MAGDENNETESEPRNEWDYEMPETGLIRGDVPTDPGADRATEPSPAPPAAAPAPPHPPAPPTTQVPPPPAPPEAPAAPPPPPAPPAPVPPPPAPPPSQHTLAPGAAAVGAVAGGETIHIPAPVSDPTPPPPEDSGGVSRGLVMGIWGAAAVIAVIAVVLLLTRGGDDGERLVAVPDLSSTSSPEEAEALLDDAGLRLGLVTRVEEGEPGEIISQDPSPGTELEEGATVDLSIGQESQEPDVVAVPQLTGLSEEEARAALADAGFEVVTVEPVEDGAEPGTVVSVTPSPGTEHDPAEPVVLAISTGPAQENVPIVDGLEVAAAEQAMTAVGFMSERMLVASDTAPVGTVIATDPSGGTPIDAGSTVILVVSTGPGNVAVPTLVGTNALEASAELRSLGFTVNTTTCQLTDAEADDAGLVVEQIPAAGAEIRSGSPVTICVGAAPEPTPTPVPTATPVPQVAPPPTPVPRPPTPVPDPGGCPPDDPDCR